jgi:tRNA dimethylallyltransferase
MLIVCGPTGVGKSFLSIELAKQYPIEVINMDVGQLYTPFSIGTAKPNLKSQPCKHHLFNLISNPEDFSVVRYRELVKNLVKEIYGRGNLPVLVGGSGFYLSSLLFPPTAKKNSPRNYQSLGSYAQEDTVALWQQLQERDQQRADAIDKRDRYRIIRALDLLHKDYLPSSHNLLYRPLSNDYYIVWLSRERKELYTRINHRTNVMMHHGWLDEVRSVMGTSWQSFIMHKKLIGYDEIVTYLSKNYSDEKKLINAIQIRTRHYAKRQMTFWRMLKKKLATHKVFDKYSEYMLDENRHKSILQTLVPIIKQKGFIK